MQDAVKELNMQVLHIGLNAKDGEQAMEWAKEFEESFGLPIREGNSSIFSGNLVEIMKGKGRGAVGHIAIGVNNCEKAIEYFASRGVHAIPETIKEKDGRITFAYLDKEIAGFLVHINLTE